MEEVTTIGLDLAKHVFQAHGASASGAVLFRKKLRRDQVLTFLAGLPHCLVAMEACASAHHWGRAIGELAHEVRLILPQYVRPYVKAQGRMTIATPKRSPRPRTPWSRQACRLRPAAKHHGDDERHLDHRHRDGEHERPKRLADPVRHHLRVVDGSEHSCPEDERRRRGERPAHAGEGGGHKERAGERGPSPGPPGTAICAE